MLTDLNLKVFVSVNVIFTEQRCDQIFVPRTEEGVCASSFGSSRRIRQTEVDCEH